MFVEQWFLYVDQLNNNKRDNINKTGTPYFTSSLFALNSTIYIFFTMGECFILLLANLVLNHMVTQIPSNNTIWDKLLNIYSIQFFILSNVICIVWSKLRIRICPFVNIVFVVSDG